MRLRLRPGRYAIVAAAGAVVALAAGGIAYATIPDGGGLIHGCYKNPSGELRVVDDPATCKSNETALPWSQTGPQGPAGPAGEPGPAGPPGQAGAGNANGVTGEDAVVNEAATVDAVSVPLTIPVGDGSPHKVLLTGQVMIFCSACTTAGPMQLNVEVLDGSTPATASSTYSTLLSTVHTIVPYSFLSSASEGGHTYRLRLTSSGVFPIVIQGPTLNAVDTGAS